MTEERIAEVRAKRVAQAQKMRDAKKARKAAIAAAGVPAKGAFAFFCRFHFGDRLGKADMRVWREGWAGDAFEVLDSRKFNKLVKLMHHFSVPVYLLLTDEDDEFYESKAYGRLTTVTPDDV